MRRDRYHVQHIGDSISWMASGVAGVFPGASSATYVRDRYGPKHRRLTPDFICYISLAEA